MLRNNSFFLPTEAYEILNRYLDSGARDDEALQDNVSFRINTAHKILNTLADRGLVDKVKEIFNLMVSCKLIEPSPYLLGPLIRVHVKR